MQIIPKDEDDRQSDPGAQTKLISVRRSDSFAGGASEGMLKMFVLKTQENMSCQKTKIEILLVCNKSLRHCVRDKRKVSV